MVCDSVSFCVKMPRRHCSVSAQDRQRIIQAYRDGSDSTAEARRPSVKRTAAWSIVAKRIQTGEAEAGRKDGNRPRLVDDEILDFDRVGAVYHEIVWGGVDCERFQVFLENLAIVLDEEQTGSHHHGQRAGARPGRDAGNTQGQKTGALLSVPELD